MRLDDAATFPNDESDVAFGTNAVTAATSKAVDENDVWPLLSKVERRSALSVVAW